jgi:hypothetical protein
VVANKITGAFVTTGRVKTRCKAVLHYPKLC